MSRRRNNGNNGLEGWPGYVDALSTLLMVTIFVLLVFVLAEAFLSYALKGSDNTITQLKEQIAELTQSLSMESSKDATLSQELAALNAQLASAQAANATLTQQLSTDTATISSLQDSQKSLQAQLSDTQAQAAAATGRIATLQAQMQAVGGSDLQSKLSDAQKLNKQDAAQIALLNQQMAALRAQLAALQVALDAAQSADKQDKVRIADLGKQLNEALARKVEELQKYQSVFFKTLSESLKGEKNIRVVGDRFVFESDVLFPVDEATITPAGKTEIAQVAKAINKIAAKIPSNVNWVLSVDGYADAQPIKGGPYKTNFDLSTARALAVLDLLLADGVPKNRLMASGMGSNNPIASGNTAADYAQNRRIEFRLTTP
ncbi:peptidoglycan -binding protein [Acidocella aminolytica]|jgi:chemotaxis protein MotB|uniref:Outer membrane protein/flagellar motor protein OmpA/MotB n=1 Tax=Acidocella aminolytica 101 = DSM 11237 TaxID=1120923 RepID=A0A0D6PBW8_9PROT|nr:peptidoglycan -binding protein [Acidocella aminolytica]GAN78693.1 outer membrane protein/flagellar motor protein OmpA/MotB [Acidocella aminolytica 101 = DSM 11237]GBQ33950.1 flagellar motor protein [Acidocella aminolytica 101 = DSM 11237]SHE36396.1 chemotaxis protein MotB [Acidocella aminolytica 101 = DSM 11237]